jgi:transcriptional regulator of acetoin/glycerol metabolism
MTSDNFIKPGDLMFQTVDNPTETESEIFNLAIHEKTLIVKALDEFGWNMSKTANELGINRSTLYDKIKKYEL